MTTKADNSETRPVMLTEEDRRIISAVLRERADDETVAALASQDGRYSVEGVFHAELADKCRALANKIEEVANV